MLNACWGNHCSNSVSMTNKSSCVRACLKLYRLSAFVCPSTCAFLCQCYIYITPRLSVSSVCLSLCVVCVHLSLSQCVCVCVSGHLFSVGSGPDSRSLSSSLCSGIKKTDKCHNSFSDVPSLSALFIIGAHMPELFGQRSF